MTVSNYSKRTVVLLYRKFPKYSDTQKISCNHSKVWTIWLYHRVMSPNGKQCRPWSDCCLIWVCTVCPGISVRKLRIITVYNYGCQKGVGSTVNSEDPYCLRCLAQACPSTKGHHGSFLALYCNVEQFAWFSVRFCFIYTFVIVVYEVVDVYMNLVMRKPV